MTDERVRLDKWLWAARLFKTRSLAVEAIERGRVSVNGIVAKASREVRAGERIVVRQPPFVRELRVQGVSTRRGPASVAQALYVETPESIAQREAIAKARRSEPVPEQGRPTKRDRRALADWHRWSASIDDAE